MKNDINKKNINGIKLRQMIEMISMKENSKPKVAEYLTRQWISKYNLIVV